MHENWQYALGNVDGNNNKLCINVQTKPSTNSWATIWPLGLKGDGLSWCGASLYLIDKLMQLAMPIRTDRWCEMWDTGGRGTAEGAARPVVRDVTSTSSTGSTSYAGREKGGTVFLSG